MKKNKTVAFYLFFALPLSLLCSCGKSLQNSTGQIGSTSTATAINATTTTAFTTLVWLDEFDGTAVNTANWATTWVAEDGAITRKNITRPLMQL